MTPTRVAFVDSDAKMGGVEFSTLYLARMLDRAEWEAIVTCPVEGDLPRLCRESGLQVRILPRPAFRSVSLRVGRNLRIPNPLAWLWDGAVVYETARRLARWLRDERIELVVTKGMFSHLYGGVAVRMAGLPCLWHLQDHISDRYRGMYARAVGLLASRFATRIVVDGGSIARQLPATLAGRTEVVLNGIDTDEFRPLLELRSVVRAELGVPEHALVVGHVGRMTPWKGQHHLLEAFARVAPAVPSAHLLFVGSPVFDSAGYETSLQERATALGLGERVTFAGYRHDLPRVFSAMDVFGYTSVEKDTSPLALLSGMACGRPLVAFEIEGVREVVGDSTNALLVKTGDDAELANALERVLRDGALRARLAEAARQRAVDTFSLSQHVARMTMEMRATRTASRKAAQNADSAADTPARL